MNLHQLEIDINSSSYEKRIAAAQEIRELIRKGTVRFPSLAEVNNHVHTSFSFSPYEPAAAVYRAKKAGLSIVGSVDHDSIGASLETKRVGEILSIAATTGFEVRVSFLNTPFASRKINNPDSPGIVYMVVHGVKHSAVESVRQFLEPIRKARMERNRKQVTALNDILLGKGVGLIDFDTEVIPLSKWSEGGEITERHILFALAKKLQKNLVKPVELVRFLREEMGVEIKETIQTLLLDENNPHYLYDLLGVMKSAFLPSFFIQPSRDEIPEVKAVVDFALSIDAIPAYAYLGDIEQSVTGDKKAEKFEDDFLDELVAYLADLGFPAITYMPPRNSKAQMARLQSLCRKYHLMEISGVDINSSRQSFNCPELLEPEAVHLVDSAWALVAHEILVEESSSYSLFAGDNPLGPNLSDRITTYSALARAMDPGDTSSVLTSVSHLLEKGESRT
ncbi:MAG: PHP domain-containing protein [Sphaerochaetaceae bacterium]|nr:PHP domain-containing protein [Sphaerochaetaceae bacterium]